MERATGIEPAFTAWEAVVLPMNYARKAQKTLSQYVTHTVGGKIAGGEIRFISEVLRRKRHTVPFLNRLRIVTRWLFFCLMFC